MVAASKCYMHWFLLADLFALQIGGVVTPHDGQCHLRRVTSGGETYYKYEEDLRLVRKTLPMADFGDKHITIS